LTEQEISEIDSILDEVSPPIDSSNYENINLNFEFNPKIGMEFKGKLEFNPRFINRNEYRIYLIRQIISEKYYFDPKYFDFDVKRRTLFTRDFRIELKLDFNFIIINQEYLFFILSVMQLNLLGIIERDRTEKLIEIIAKYLSIKISMNYKYKSVSLIRFVGGKEIDRIECTLRSEDFEKEILSQITKILIRWTPSGFDYYHST
jgi:hypothetical protein